MYMSHNTHSISEEKDGTALVDGVGHGESKPPVGVEGGEPALGVEVFTSE